MYLLLLFAWLTQAFSVTSVPPAPVRVVLKSANMSHMLLWDRGAQTAAEVHYSVSFHTDRGQCCRLVPGCDRVVEHLVCNLTEAFSDPEETYHMRVTAQLRSEQSSSPWSKFNPIKDTELQPPVLHLEHCESSLCVDLDAPVPALYSIYNNFQYELKVQKDSGPPMVKRLRSLRRHTEPGVKEGSQYCVSIRFNDGSVPRVSSYSPSQCIYIHSPRSAESLLAVIPFLLVLLVLVVLPLVYSGHICFRRRALPSALTSVCHVEKRLMVFIHPPLSSLSISKQSAPSYGQTEFCSSESDDSEDESDEVDGRVYAHAALYRSKGSLCSVPSLSPSAPHSKEAKTEREEQEGRTEREQQEAKTEREEQEGRTEREEQEGRTDEVEEVNLLTLTFSRDADLEHDRAVVLSEMDPPVWDVAEEHEPEEGFGEKCCQSGYMSR